MSTEQSVLVVTKSKELAATVTRTTLSCARMKCLGACQHLSELVARQERNAAPIAIVDLGSQPSAMLVELEPIIRRFPETKFVLLSGTMESNLILEAMQIGGRHFMSRDLVETQLVPVLQKLMATMHWGNASAGTVLTVLSAGGGCGATTLSINLANELGLESNQPALLMDMDIHLGSAATYLGAKGQYGLADVLAREGSIDTQLVRSSSMTVSDSLCLLLSPATINFASPTPLDYHRLSEAIEACRWTYKHTVIDAPRMPISAAAALAKMSNFTLIVMQLTVKDLAIARQLRQALLDEGVSPGCIKPIVGRYCKHTMVDLDMAKEAFGQNHFELIGNDFRNALRGVNYGKCLSEVAPTSALRKDIRTLASNLAFKAMSEGAVQS